MEFLELLLASVLEAYSCRWQIEVLFKTWKSHFQLGLKYLRS